jgi:regulator of sirC expression with transglutaminase-like and TPR domain
MENWNQLNPKDKQGPASHSESEILQDLIHISTLLAPETSAQWLHKRLLFFCYELESALGNLKGPEFSLQNRLAFLNSFFFEDKQFFCTTPPFSFEAQLLGHALSTRSGAPFLIAAIYAYMAKRLDIFLEFVELELTCLLKWEFGENTYFIDMAQSGKFLSSRQLIEVIYGNKVLSETDESLFSIYLNKLKSTLPQNIDLNLALSFQNVLIKNDPFNLQFVAERALIHRKLGNLKSAFADLKRFFSFHESDKIPAELLALHTELLILLDR